MLHIVFPEHKAGIEDPADGWVWTAPDGTKIRNLHRTTWYGMIFKHCKDNGYPIPSKEEIDHQWCLGAPPGWCRHETGEGWQGFTTRLTAQDYLHGTVVLAQISAEPDPLVDKELAEQRARKCAACPANLQVSGCIPCLGIANFILQIKGSQETSCDALLNTCAHCKCSNAAQVWVKTEILAKHTDATALAGMRAMPDCWKSFEIDQLSRQS